MTNPNESEDAVLDLDALNRSTLCISSNSPGLALHAGDPGYITAIGRHYSPAEANANEKLCKLKHQLPQLATDEFWTTVMEGITDIIGSQYALAVRRLLPGDPEATVEMPELGDPGQCLTATAFFYNDGAMLREHFRNYKYHPQSGPCSHMRHDKTFVVPDQLSHFIGDQINKFAFPVESYIGIPLFSPGGECIGHFGALWSKKGMKERRLSWGFVEMALHSLEDMVTRKLLEGNAFTKQPGTGPSQVIPASVVNAAQSLKPYARSLSHELRTPMQGVVGMLDIMHATVSEALETSLMPETAEIFRKLRENIEVVQDSSRRAVEAADNVVHAADLDMQVPQTPDPPEDFGRRALRQNSDYLLAGRQRNDQSNDKKRKRGDRNLSPPTKYIAIDAPTIPPRPLTPRTAAVRSAVRESGHITGVSHPNLGPTAYSDGDMIHSTIMTSMKVTRVRDHLRTTVNECLRYGGRPESAIAEDTEHGEKIDVRSRNVKGQISTKCVQWSVSPDVPDEVQVDERDFTKLVSVLLLNALKFTQEGQVRLSAKLGSTSRVLIVNVLDTGTGIPSEFIPNLFKAFSRQDDTITRQNEGLGLGLMVAKSVARKLGGDLRCIRSDTAGPLQGSEFEFKVPLSPSEVSSRQSSPNETPTPSYGNNGPEGTEMRPSGSNWSRRSSHNDAEVASPPKSSPKWNVEKKAVGSRQSRLTPPRAADKGTALRRSSIVRPLPVEFDRKLAKRHPLQFLVAEDNRLNRKLLVTMLSKLGYTAVNEAFDGAEAVRLMKHSFNRLERNEYNSHFDVILMDLWMPNMDGYEASRRILEMEHQRMAEKKDYRPVKILAVTADVTDGALDRAKEAGMIGFMTKPYKMMDLERLILEHCVTSA